MEYQTESVLAYCDPAFAREWSMIDQMHTVIVNSFGAAAVIELNSDDSMTIALHARGFDELFGLEFTQGVVDHAMLIVMRDRAQFIEACKKAAQTGESASLRCSWRCKHPRLKGIDFIRTRASIQKVGDGPNGSQVFYLALKDVTERYDKRADLTRSQLATALQLVYAEVTLIDIDTGVATPIYMGGRDLRDAETGEFQDAGLHKIFTLLHPEDKRHFWQFASMSNMERELFNPESEKNASITTDLRRLGADGAYHWVTLNIFKVNYDDNRRTVLFCQRNIDEQKEAQRRERDLRSRAQLDGLTGIFNRGTTEELISSMLQGREADESYVFAVFDVDNFKHVNDSYGHLMGDELLKCAANNIQAICRERDIVGRIGGDEFVALLSGKAANGIQSVQERLGSCMDELAKFSAEQNVEPPVTLSIGLVAVPQEAMTYHEVFAMADKTLYNVKGKGKNGYELYIP